MADSKVRRFCFTWNNYSDEDFEKVKQYITNNCKYGIVGKELAPNTGTRHLQGFCNLTKPTRFSSIKKSLHHSIHIEKAAGTDTQNKEYCGKSGDTFEKGTPCTQGQRNDLQAVVESIATGTTLIQDIATKHPVQFIKYHNGIRKYLNIVHPIKPRNFMTNVYYYWGPPGTGKSLRALKEASAINKESIYYKPRGQWWDGYRQHECVIIDDFYGWIKYDELLKICDRYPYKVQIKGGYEEFTTKHIWITSNIDTNLLYKFEGYSTGALERRIKNKVHIK